MDTFYQNILYFYILFMQYPVFFPNTCSVISLRVYLHILNTINFLILCNWNIYWFMLFRLLSIIPAEISILLFYLYYVTVLSYYILLYYLTWRNIIVFLC